MMQVLMVLWVANRKVYGAQKLWIEARRAGHDIGRDHVARLMRAMDIEGVSRQRRKVFTTRQDRGATRAPDLVKRDFTATAPNELWVTDLTYVPTRSAMSYVCFIVDAFSRKIVGWRVASHMRTDMVLDALEMARRSRGNRRLVGLVTHSDAGAQFTSVRFTERLDEIELATLNWVHWFNEHRLHSHCGYVPPNEYEAAFYAAPQTTPTGVGNT
jgi:putative transposase